MSGGGAAILLGRILPARADSTVAVLAALTTWTLMPPPEAVGALRIFVREAVILLIALWSRVEVAARSVARATATALAAMVAAQSACLEAQIF
jgi:hypothetical protein